MKVGIMKKLKPKPKKPLRAFFRGHSRRSEGGYTLVELLIAVGILAIMTSSVMMARSFMAKQTVRTVQKAFATQKAIQMFEELRALVNGNEKLGVSILDNYSDGSLFNTVLTTNKMTDTSPPGSGNPADPVSGNVPINGHWLYLRQVQVNRLANDPNARQVMIKVWRYASDQNPNQPGELLATVGGMLRTIQGLFPPTQVYDLYILDVQTIQAWWDVLPTLTGGIQSVISDFQNRNPGLVLRAHYITRASFGRDSQYVPFINSAKGTDAAPMSWAYFYPGSSPQDASPNGCGCENIFFDPSPSIDATSGGAPQCGVFNVDGNITQPINSYVHPIASAAGAPSFAVCDQANNAMRFPDELALYQSVTQAAFNAGQTVVPEISERLLIEGMNSYPASFANAMIINMHGELLPLPALRNYSDAAKDPGSYGTTNGANILNPKPNPGLYPTNDDFNDQYIRVVTHPELLYYPTTAASVTVNLRVYAYADGWQDQQSTLDNAVSTGTQVPAISVFLPDYNSLNLGTANVVGVTYVDGGAGVTYKYDNLISGCGGSCWYGAAGDPVTMKLSYVGAAQQALFTLYNTDARCPSGLNNTGLNSNDRLYGLEYIPCAPDRTVTLSSYSNYTGAYGGFTGKDLTSTGGSGTPKNTARWIISLSLPVQSSFPVAAGTFSVLGQNYTAPVTFPTVLGLGGNNAHVIETRLGDGVTASAVTQANGTVVSLPPNLSRTYLWLGNSYPPPATEQYQMVGDPRHCPYLDCKVGGIALGGTQPVTIGSNSYNWYFKRGDNGGGGVTTMYNQGYRGFGAGGSNNGWANGDEVDIPKYDRLIREGLMKTTSIWTTLNGWSFYYYALGGEFGFDHPPYTNSIKIEQAPYLTTTTGMTTVKTVNELVNWNGGTLNIPNEHLVAYTGNGGGVGTKDAWYSRYWMGELYPDSAYSTWVTYGNLPTVANPMGGDDFFREDYGNLQSANSNTGFRGSYIRLQGPNGCSSYFLGGGTSNNWYNHEGSGSTGNISNMAQSCYGIFTYQLPPVVSVQRPWNLSGSGNTPPESGSAPYSGMLNRLTIPTVASDSVSRIFYSSDQYISGNSSNNNWYGSGLVQVDNVSPGSSLNGSTQRAYVVETGTSPSANVGTQDLTETALTNTLRSFLDGGVLYNPGKLGHISQVPLVELWSSIVPQFANPSSIPLVIDGAVTTGTPVTLSGFLTIGAGPTTNVWYRYPGVTSNTANFYTEEYPNYGSGVTASTYSDSGVSLVYNLKYSNDPGKQYWYYMQNPGVTAVFGQYDPSYAVTGTLPITYSLSTPSSTFPQGDYWMMVEAYRINTATANYMPLHYAYHILDLTINR